MEAFVKSLPKIQEFEANFDILTVTEPTIVPVFFTVYRRNNGLPYQPNLPVTQEYLDYLLAEANTIYEQAGLEFQQCGSTNYIDSDAMNYNVFGRIGSEIAYVSSALNVTIYPGFMNASSSASFPFILSAPDFGEPNPDPFYSNNTISLASNDNGLGELSSIAKAFAHEIGHSYGLLHTFEGAQAYDMPPPGIPTPGSSGEYYDHPYGFPDPNPELDPVARELVIRTEDPSKTFQQPNWNRGGDYIEDTPAFCRGGRPTHFPAIADENCQEIPDATICDGCRIFLVSDDLDGDGELNDCVLYINSYRDYNGDAMQNTEIGLHNIMSYAPSICRRNLTNGQYERIQFYNQEVRTQQYDLASCVNVRDKIEYEGTAIGIKNVVVRSKNSADLRRSNTVSQNDGSFQGIFYNNLMSTENLILGSIDPPLPPPATNDFLIYDNFYNSHSNQDWLKGVTTIDLVRLRSHILNIDPFDDGYSFIAGDVNNSGSVTAFDIIAISKLILGVTSSFPSYPMPWVFVPEYVSEVHADQFHSTPFDMTIAGTTYNDAAYISPDWEYEITDGLNGRNGFDAVKLGDVNSSIQSNLEDGSSPMSSNCPTEEVVMYHPQIDPLGNDRLIKMDILPTAEANLIAWQMSFALDKAHVELVDIQVNDRYREFSKEYNIGWEKYENEGILPMLWIPMSLKEEEGHSSSHEGGGMAENSLHREVEMKNNEPIVSIYLRTKTSIDDLDPNVLLSDFIPAVFYDENGCEVELQLESDVKLLAENPGLVIDDTSYPEATYSINMFSCFPNPIKDGLLNWRYKAIEGSQALLKIADLLGQEVFSEKVTLIKGINEQQIDMNKLSKGVLLVTLFDGNKPHTIRVLNL